MNNTAIKLTNVSKKYIVYGERPTLAERLLVNRREEFFAVNNINLTIKKGERVGIIGANGCGKTTLLKIISGITMPTSGTVETQGKVVSLIDLEAGFHPEFTGIQNIYLSGMLLGLNRKSVTLAVDDIVRYAGLKKFIQAPLYTYSAGMRLRLGFAVALHAKPEILVIDEGVNVGDKKFSDRIRNDSKKIFDGKTLVVASHNMYTIIDHCERVYVMDKGKIIHSGGLTDTMAFYDRDSLPAYRWYMKNRHKRKL